MLIREYEIHVDIEEELEPYLDEFPQCRVRGNKLQSCSPFRPESHPSFAVNLDNGTFIDSGSTDEHYYKGNFVKLLSYLQGVTYEEVEDYLLEKYHLIKADTDALKLSVQLTKEVTQYKEPDLERYAYRHEYLGSRGISERVQKAFQIGYDKKGKAVTLVWHDKDGKPINMKFRSVTDKRFWYMSGGKPIKQNVYGLHFVRRMKAKTVVVVESEIDALYLWTNKQPAIALGSASMSKEQERLILTSGIETLLLAFDNDTAGMRATNDVVRRLLGKLSLKKVNIPTGLKDVNDIPVGALIDIIHKSEYMFPKIKL